MPLVDVTERQGQPQNTNDTMPVSGLNDRMEAGYRQLLSDNHADLLKLYYPVFASGIERARKFETKIV